LELAGQTEWATWLWTDASGAPVVTVVPAIVILAGCLFGPLGAAADQTTATTYAAVVVNDTTTCIESQSWKVLNDPLEQDPLKLIQAGKG